jgi:hypothetical protein
LVGTDPYSSDLYFTSSEPSICNSNSNSSSDISLISGETNSTSLSINVSDIFEALVSAINSNPVVFKNIIDDSTVIDTFTNLVSAVSDTKVEQTVTFKNSLSECVDVSTYVTSEDLNASNIAEITNIALTANSYPLWDSYEIANYISIERMPYSSQFALKIGGLTKNVNLNNYLNHTIDFGGKYLTFSEDGNITIDSTSSCVQTCPDTIDDINGTQYYYDNNGSCELVESDSFYKFEDGKVLFNSKSNNTYSPTYRWYNDDSNVSTLTIYTSLGDKFKIEPIYNLSTDITVTSDMLPIIFELSTLEALGKSTDLNNFEVTLSKKFMDFDTAQFPITKGIKSAETALNLSQILGYKFFYENAGYVISSTALSDTVNKLNIKKSYMNDYVTYHFRGYEHNNKVTGYRYYMEAKYLYDNISKGLE